GQRAEARLAFAQRRLGAATLQEEAELAADHAHGAEETGVGLADGIARDRYRADDPVAGGDGKYQRAVHAVLARQTGKRHAPVARRILDPDRPAGGPHAAHEPHAARIGLPA